MRERHEYRLEGGSELTTMGATWFVSYSYHKIVDSFHMNWSRVSTASSRRSVYSCTEYYHEYWLWAVLHMSDSRLDTNSIGLSGAQVKRMAYEVLKKLKQRKKETVKLNLYSSSQNQQHYTKVLTKNKIPDETIKETHSEVNENDIIKIQKKVLNTFVAQRSVSPVSGYSKFKTKDNIYILADEKGMENKSLPWANENVEITVYEESVKKINFNLTEKEEKIISDWSWKKIT